MGAYESMDAKVRQIGPLPTETVTNFLDKHCFRKEEAASPLKPLALAFALFLLQHEDTRLQIAQGFEEPRKGKYNILLWSHYAEKVLLTSLKEKEIICVGTHSDAIVFGLSLSRWPNPIKTSERYTITLK
jgi:hypothetical protein